MSLVNMRQTNNEMTDMKKGPVLPGLLFGKEDIMLPPGKDTGNR